MPSRDDRLANIDIRLVPCPILEVRIITEFTVRSVVKDPPSTLNIEISVLDVQFTEALVVAFLLEFFHKFFSTKV